MARFWLERYALSRIGTSSLVRKDSQLEGILTGDTIAGRHTVLLSETDGDLAEYLKTLTCWKSAARTSL